MIDQQVYNLLLVSQNLQCVRQEHEPEKLSRACLRKDCKISRLICSNCENDHFAHREETFTFREIQDFMDEYLQINTENIIEQLDMLSNLLGNTIKQIKNDFLQMKKQFFSLFPYIDNTSYNGIKQYIEIVFANVEIRNKKIIFKGYSQIFKQVKQKIEVLQVRLKRVNDTMEIIINDVQKYPIEYIKPIEPISKTNQLIEQNKQQLILKNNHNLQQISINICCAKKDHQFDQILQVCLFPECEIERIQCKKCIRGHQFHRQFCISIKEFDETCALFTVDNEQEYRIKQIKKELDDIVNDLNQDFLNILKPNLFIQMYLQKNEIQNYDDLNTAIEQLTNYVEINNNGDLIFKLSEENTLNQYVHSKFKNCAWNIYDIIKKQEPLIETAKIAKSEAIQSSLLQDELKQQSIFYKQQCSQSIQIINQRIVKKHSNTNFNDVALLSKDIDPKQSKSYIFRINNQNGAIAIGFANAVKIQRKDYILTNLSRLGNGIYMIASYPGKQALSYNDKDQNYNKQQQKINFTQGHQYKLIYDPKNSNRQQFCIEHIVDSVVVENFKMPMVIEINDQYHPLILISQRDDEVELLLES